MKQPAVFMDRDGTLIADTGYVRRPEDVRLLPQADQAVRLLNDAGFKTVLVTNQSGVARGLMTPDDVEAVNRRLIELLGPAGGRLDGIYYCPHLPEGTIPEYTAVCSCRKPKPGLLLRAAEEMDLDLGASYMVGDSPRDLEAGKAAGCKAILIDRGVPVGNMDRSIVANMLEAAEAILQDSGRTGAPRLVEASAEFIPEPELEPDNDAGLDDEAGAPAQVASLEAAPKVAPIPDATPALPSVADQPLATEPEPDVKVMTERGIGNPVEKPRPAAAPVVAEKGPPEPQPAKTQSVLPTEKSDRVLEPLTDEELVNCEQCGSMIPGVDLLRGRARRVDGKILCRDCNIYHQARTTQARPVTNVDLLAELKNISRALAYEKFSVFNIFGGLAQAGVFAAMLYAVISHSVNEGLLWAIALQLVALTFFILGRQ